MPYKLRPGAPPWQFYMVRTDLESGQELLDGPSPT